MGLYRFDLQQLLPPSKCWKHSMHFSQRLCESLATCILLFSFKCILLSLQIIIVKTIELSIFTKFICCCFIVYKWSRIFLCCKLNFCSIQFILYGQWFVQLSHGILGIGFVRLVRQICGVHVIYLDVQPEVQKVAINQISTRFQFLAQNHEVNFLMRVA